MCIRCHGNRHAAGTLPAEIVTRPTFLTCVKLSARLRSLVCGYRKRALMCAFLLYVAVARERRLRSYQAHVRTRSYVEYGPHATPVFFFVQNKGGGVEWHAAHCCHPQVGALRYSFAWTRPPWPWTVTDHIAHFTWTFITLIILRLFNCLWIHRRIRIRIAL